MPSILLQTATVALAPTQMAFSLFLLWRGHNEPGGGFAAGLLFAAALCLIALSYSARRARELMRIEPLSLAGIGLLTAFSSAILGPLNGEPFLTGMWVELNLGFMKLDLGSPLLFDIGVYLLVIGISTAIIFGLMDTNVEGAEDEWNS